MTDPRQLQFWSDEELRLWDEAAPVLLSLIFSGGRSGHDLLPEGARILMNWDVFNEDAISYLNDYRMSTWANINRVSREHTVSIIDDWIRSGEHLDVLSARLEPWYSPERAERVAVTEVTRIYAEGNQLAWRATGLVSHNRWNTARDERVCPICAPLHGMVVELGANGFTTQGGIGITAPPAHPRCRCWLAPVVSEEGLREQIRGLLA